MRPIKATAGTGFRGAVGIGTYEVEDNARGHVEIYRAMDGRIVATIVAVGERAVAADAIVRRVTVNTKPRLLN